MPSTLLIRDALLDGRRVNVLIAGNRFADLDSAATEADTVIDAAGMALLPPFYNTHCHAAMTLLRGWAEDMSLFDWLNDRIWPLEAKLTPHDIYLGSKLAFLEMIRSGSVFLNDMYWHCEETIRAAQEMGVRACLGDTFMDRLGPAEIEAAFARNARLARELEGSLIRVNCAPHAIYTVSRDLLRRCGDFARDLGLTLHLHLSETAKEVEDCVKATGMSPVRYCDSLGLLDERAVAAHCVCLSDDDIAVLAERQVTLSHNPCSNMKLASGVFRAADCVAAGCRVALGTDGCSSNNNLDMREEMKFAALLAKVSGGPEAVTARQVFAWATSAGARAFGLEAGEIAVGRLADAILVDISGERFCPGHDLIYDWVYSAQSSSVDTVICDGRPLMRQRHVAGEEEILAEARRATAELRRRAGL